jgi:HEAT repeat protein
VPVLIAFSREPPPEGGIFEFSARREAVTALALLGPQAREALPVLVEALKDSDTAPVLPEKAARGLGRMGPAAAPAVPRLIEMLEPGDSLARDYRVAAAEALGDIGPVARDALPKLEELARGEDDEAAWAAAAAIRKIRGR